MSSSIMSLVLALRGRCDQAVRQIQEETQLSPAECRGLMALETRASWSAADFSGKLGLSVSRGSRVAEKMIRNGYLERSQAPDDRRSQRITLAPAGVALQKRLAAAFQGCERKIKNRLKPEELAQVEAALRKLLEVI